MLIKIFKNSVCAESSSLLRRYNSQLLNSDIFLGIHNLINYTKIKLVIFFPVNHIVFLVLANRPANLKSCKSNLLSSQYLNTSFMAEIYLAKDFLKNFQNLRTIYSFVSQISSACPSQELCWGQIKPGKRKKYIHHLVRYCVRGEKAENEAPEGRILPKILPQVWRQVLTGTLSAAVPIRPV